jgi:hypothetical protein
MNFGTYIRKVKDRKTLYDVLLSADSVQAAERLAQEKIDADNLGFKVLYAEKANRNGVSVFIYRVVLKRA